MNILFTIAVHHDDPALQIVRKFVYLLEHSDVDYTEEIGGYIYLGFVYTIAFSSALFPRRDRIFPRPSKRASRFPRHTSCHTTSFPRRKASMSGKSAEKKPIV